MDNISSYSDLDLTFKAHPVKKDISLFIGELAVVKALKNLLMTNFYEKPFNHNYGSNIRAMLFEPISPITAAMINKEVETAIKNYEPRISIKSLSVNALYDYNSYQVSLEFYIENLVQPYSADFLLSRIR